MPISWRQALDDNPQFGKSSQGLVSVPPEDHAASILNDFDESLTEALEFTAAFTPEAFPNLIEHFDPV